MRMWNGTLARSPRHIKVSLSRDVFERRTSTRSRIFAHLIRDFEQIFEQIVSIRVKKLSNTNLVASRNIKREKGSLPVDVRSSKMSLLKLPTICLTCSCFQNTCCLFKSVSGKFHSYPCLPFMTLLCNGF